MEIIAFILVLPSQGEINRPLIVHLQIVALLKESRLLDGENPRTRWFLSSFRSFSRLARTDSKSGACEWSESGAV